MTPEDPRTVRGTESEDEWVTLPPPHLPPPTYWPVVLALGVTFIAWGIVTTVTISAIGLVLFAIALRGWIGEWRHGE